MKKRFLLLLIPFLFFISCSQTKNRDLEYENKLIGTWHKDLKIQNRITHVVTKFTKDHRFATYAKIQGTNKKLYAYGVWKVKFGVLNETILKSNYTTKHTQTFDKILSITSKQFVYKTESGEVFSYYRSR